MSTAEYLQLLDWMARQVQADKRGSTPQEFAPLFDRLGVSAEIWCRLVNDFGKLFKVVAGQSRWIDSHSSKTRRAAHRFRIRRGAREWMTSCSAAGC